MDGNRFPNTKVGAVRFNETANSRMNRSSSVVPPRHVDGRATITPEVIQKELFHDRNADVFKQRSYAAM